MVRVDCILSDFSDSVQLVIFGIVIVADNLNRKFFSIPAGYKPPPDPKRPRSEDVEMGIQAQ